MTAPVGASPDAQPLLTLIAVRARLGTSYEHVLGLVHSGALRAIDVGSPRKPMYRVDSRDLDAYLSRRATVPAGDSSGEAA